MPGLAPCAFPLMTIILMTFLEAHDCHYPHFRDEKTKAQRDYIIGEWWSWDFNPGSLAPERLYTKGNSTQMQETYSNTHIGPVISLPFSQPQWSADRYGRDKENALERTQEPSSWSVMEYHPNLLNLAVHIIYIMILKHLHSFLPLKGIQINGSGWRNSPHGKCLLLNLLLLFFACFGLL